MSRLGVLLPAYNEEENIQTVIDETMAHLPGSEIVVVDDGSADNTFELAMSKGVTVLKHEKNRGKGEALRTGFKYFLNQSVDFVIVSDTDSQYKLEEAPKILE